MRGDHAQDLVVRCHGQRTPPLGHERPQEDDPLGRPPRPLVRADRDPADGGLAGLEPPLGGRHRAERSVRVREGHDGGRRVRDRAQRQGGRGSPGLDEVGHRRRTDRQDHRVEPLDRPVGEGRGRAGRVPLEPLDARREADVRTARAQVRLQPLGQRAEPGAQAAEGRARCGRTRGPGPAAGVAALRQAGDHQAAVLLLAGPQGGQDRIEAELVDPGPVDPADQRLGEPIDHAVTEPSAQERPGGGVGGAQPAGQHEVQPGARLVPPGQDRGRHEGPHPGGQDHAHAVGQRQQPAVGAQVDRARAADGDDLVGHPQVVDQAEGGRAVGDERVRTVLDREPVHPLGAHLAADLRGGLDQGHPGTGAHGLPGRAQPGDPGADDQDVGHPWGFCARAARTGTAGRTPAGRRSTRRPAPASRRTTSGTRSARSGP